MQQCSSLMCFNGFWTIMDIYGKKKKHISLWLNSRYLSEYYQSYHLSIFQPVINKHYCLCLHPKCEQTYDKVKKHNESDLVVASSQLI